MTPQEELEMLTLEKEKAMAASQPTTQPPEQPQSSLGQAWDFTKGTAQGLGESLNPLNIYQGLRHPIEPMLRELQKAKDAHDQGNTTEALARIATGVFPIIGPMLGNLAEQPGKMIYGETPQKRGEAFGQMAAIPIGGKILKGVGKVAEPLYESALNFPKSTPLAKRATIVKGGLEEGVPVSKAGLVTADEAVKGINDQIDAKIAAYEQSTPMPPTVLPSTVASRVEQIKPAYNNATMGADIQTINSLRDAFVRDRSQMVPDPNASPTIPGQNFLPGEGGLGATPETPMMQVETPMRPSELQTVKKNTYTRLKDRAYGERKGPDVEAQKAIARGAKEELGSMIPELAGLNAKEAVMIQLNQAIDSVVRSSSYHVSGPLTGLPLLTMLKSIVQNPVVKSRLALALNQARSRANTISTGTVAVGQSGEEPQ